MEHIQQPIGIVHSLRCVRCGEYVPVERIKLYDTMVDDVRDYRPLCDSCVEQLDAEIVAAESER